MLRVLRGFSSMFIATLLATAGVAEAAYGLRASESAARISRDLVAQQLFSELTSSLGHGASHDRLTRFEEQLRPIYSALPKTEAGSIDQAAARYALHRYFLTHHGWHIRGLAADGERWNSSSTLTMLKSKMPALILELLEERVGREHMGLAELAVLVATVEDLVHGDASELLLMAYDTHGLSVDRPLESQEEEDLIIQTFMTYFLIPGTQAFHSDPERIRGYLKKSPYFGWADTVLWLEDVKEAVKYQDRGVHSPFSNRQQYFRDYSSMVHLVQHLVDGIGTFQNIECKAMKHQLMELEDQDRNDGRVPLSKFYRPFVTEGNSVFSERPEYLKNLGALDDTDPKRPSVIVPNLIYGRSNCLATSGFHSLCCIDECNMLMESLERSIAHPVSSPSYVAELVAALPSDTVAAPRNLSGSLRRKLDKIAEQHGGQVPLHGRMFAQFMHHAFPNECPNPHALGAEAPMTASEWHQARNSSTQASKHELWQLAELAEEDAEGAEGAEGRRQLGEATMLWSEEEELVTSLHLQPGKDGQGGALRGALRLVAMCGATASLLSILTRSFGEMVSAFWSQGSGKAACGVSLPRWVGDTAGTAGKSHFV